MREALSTRLSFASAKPSLFAGHLLARSAYPLAVPPHPGCPGCLGGLGCPPSNGIPCGRPVHWKAAFLAGDQHPTKLPLITSKNYGIILSKDLEKLYAHYQTCIRIAQLP